MSETMFLFLVPLLVVSSSLAIMGSTSVGPPTTLGGAGGEEAESTRVEPAEHAGHTRCDLPSGYIET